MNLVADEGVDAPIVQRMREDGYTVMGTRFIMWPNYLQALLMRKYWLWQSSMPPC